ncbi:MAG: hypothetical protein IJ268_14680, partial [Proteobacteria bacterium]|nr:hypothetical protein [Pseudomonadota bacterium]
CAYCRPAALSAAPIRAAATIFSLKQYSTLKSAVSCCHKSHKKAAPKGGLASIGMRLMPIS